MEIEIAHLERREDSAEWARQRDAGLLVRGYAVRELSL